MLGQVSNPVGEYSAPNIFADTLSLPASIRIKAVYNRAMRSPYLCARLRDLSNLMPHMLYPPEKVPLLSKVRETAFSLAFFVVALLAMAGWVYWLSSIVLKIMLWCFA